MSKVNRIKRIKNGKNYLLFFNKNLDYKNLYETFKMISKRFKNCTFVGLKEETLKMIELSNEEKIFIDNILKRIND